MKPVSKMTVVRIPKRSLGRPVRREARECSHLTVLSEESESTRLATSPEAKVIQSKPTELWRVSLTDGMVKR